MPEFLYTRWDPTQEQALSAEQAFDHLADYLLQHGESLLRHLETLSEEENDILARLVRRGYLERDAQGRLQITPRGILRVQDKALAELFHLRRASSFGTHTLQHKGPGVDCSEDLRAFRYGDPPAHVCRHESLKNALLRSGPRLPVRLIEDDLVVHETERQTNCATVLLLDMSGSMGRYGKFYRARQVALALAALTRSHFPQDSFQAIGFYTFATPLSERQLLLARPRPVTLFDSRVYLRFPLEERPRRHVPEHFTNIQAGLKLARHWLRKSSAANKQIVCITDGEPTAHLEGRDLVLVYPPSRRTAEHTLQEAARCRAEGISLSLFALVEDYFYLGLVHFVKDMARVAQGVAIYCDAAELGHYVLESFLQGRYRRRPLT
ncbi:MAG: VWA domain-containing protein [Gemmataceae bacterium]